MKIKALLGFIILLLLASGAYAQDTSKPMMTPAAYDSIIRAAKRANEVKDSIRLVKVNDSLKQAYKKARRDSLKHLAHIRDSLRVKKSADSLIFVAQKQASRDSIKLVRAALRPNTGYVALSGGEGYPAGNFATYAFPTNGGVLALSAAFPGVISHFGVIFKFDIGFHGVNSQRYIDTIANQVKDPNVGYTVNSSGNYTYVTFMMGAFYTYPLSKKFSVDARLLMGAMSATIPNINVNAYDYISGANLSVMNYSTSGFAVAYDEGLSLRYLVTPRLSAMLNIDNVSSSPFFVLTNSSIAVDENGAAYQTAGQINTINQPFHVVSLTVGVGYTIVSRK
jgi:hypothetical protein